MLKKSQSATRYEFYIGLNDMDTKRQKFDDAVYERIILNVCRGYKVSYSISSVKGGYIHEDGTVEKENSVKLLILGIDDTTAEEIAKDLCVFLNQESIMILKTYVDEWFIYEAL